MSKSNLDYSSAPLFGNAWKISAEYEHLIPHAQIKSYSKGNTWLHGGLMLAFCVPPKLSTWAGIEGEGSSCLATRPLLFCIVISFPNPVKKKQKLSPTSSCQNPALVVLLLVGMCFAGWLKTTRILVLPPASLFLPASCLLTAAVSNLQGQCCQRRCLREAWVALGRKMTDSA